MRKTVRWFQKKKKKKSKIAEKRSKKSGDKNPPIWIRATNSPGKQNYRSFFPEILFCSQREKRKQLVVRINLYRRFPTLADTAKRSPRQRRTVCQLKKTMKNLSFSLSVGHVSTRIILVVYRKRDDTPIPRYDIKTIIDVRGWLPVNLHHCIIYDPRSFAALSAIGFVRNLFTMVSRNRGWSKLP